MFASANTFLIVTVLVVHASFTSSAASFLFPVSLGRERVHLDLVTLHRFISEKKHPIVSKQLAV